MLLQMRFVEISPHSRAGSSLERHHDKCKLLPRLKFHTPAIQARKRRGRCLRCHCILWYRDQPVDLIPVLDRQNMLPTWRTQRLAASRGPLDSDTSFITGLPKWPVDLPRHTLGIILSHTGNESYISKQLRFRKFGRLDYIGAPTNDSITPLEPKWRGFLRVAENPPAPRPQNTGRGYLPGLPG